MKIFVSWSGNESRAIAEALQEWLPPILMNKAELFVSSQSIEKGERGLSVIAAELEANDYGLVVLTPSNLGSRWIHFEAGALSKSVSTARVIPLFVNVAPADVEPPLSQFQGTNLLDAADVWKLVQDLLRAIDASLPVPQIKILFDSQWPEMAARVKEATATAAEPAPAPRKVEDMLEETLLTVRDISRSQASSLEEQKFQRARIDALEKAVRPYAGIAGVGGVTIGSGIAGTDLGRFSGAGSMGGGSVIAPINLGVTADAEVTKFGLETINRNLSDAEREQIYRASRVPPQPGQRTVRKPQQPNIGKK